MKNRTTSSSQTDDDFRARQHLRFDPRYYESIRDSLLDEGTSGFPNPLSSSPTQSLDIAKLEQLAHIVVASGFYCLTPSLESRYEETAPTSDPESSLSELIDRFRNHLKVRFATRIADRLDYLLDVSREEQPEQAPPSAESLKGFLAFLATNHSLACPSIVLTPKGNVRVQWRRGRNKHFAIEFTGDGKVRFVIFAPDPEHPYKTTRVAGGATIDSVMTLAAPYGVLRWAAEQPVLQEGE